jgi:hypothetical protein
LLRTAGNDNLRHSKEAIGAIAASILTAAYHILKKGALYEDLGSDHFAISACGSMHLRRPVR